MALIIFQTIGTTALIVIFYRWGLREGKKRGIDEVFDIFEQLEFTDEQINKMNKLFMKKI